MNSFHHSTSIQVRFADVDAMNHVNNAKYLTYIEIARIGYFNEVLRQGMHATPGFILARASVDFLLPIEIHDEIKVLTRCSRMGNKSFELEYEIVKTGSEPQAVVAKAQTVLVAYDYDAKQTVAVPQEWKIRIEAFEQRAF